MYCWSGVIAYAKMNSMPDSCWSDVPHPCGMSPVSGHSYPCSVAGSSVDASGSAVRSYVNNTGSGPKGSPVRSGDDCLPPSDSHARGPCYSRVLIASHGIAIHAIAIYGHANTVPFVTRAALRKILGATCTTECTVDPLYTPMICFDPDDEDCERSYYSAVDR